MKNILLVVFGILIALILMAATGHLKMTGDSVNQLKSSTENLQPTVMGKRYWYCIGALDALSIAQGHGYKGNLSGMEDTLKSSSLLTNDNFQ